MTSANSLASVVGVVAKARTMLHQDIEIMAAGGGFTKEIYHRYISFQYHLTKGVQRSILKCVGHPDLSGKKN